MSTRIRRGAVGGGLFGATLAPRAELVAGPTLLDLDLTTGLPAELVAARAGGTTIYRQTSASACVADTGAIYEDRGGDEKGVWTFGPYENSEVSIDDFSGWSSTGSPTLTGAAATGPHGVGASASKLEDGNTGTQSAIYRIIDAINSLPVVRALWFQDASPAPSSPGAMVPLYGDVAAAIAAAAPAGSGGSWRRVAGAGNYKQAVSIYPAGINRYGQPLNPSGPQQNDVDETGAVNIWGIQENYDSNFDLPLHAVGSTAAQTLRVHDDYLDQIVQGGDVDVEMAFISTLMSEGLFLPPDCYLFCAETADGELSFRYTESNGRWTLKVRGVDIGYITHRSWPGFPNRIEVRFRVWYKPSANTWGIRVFFGGCVEQENGGTTTGGALAAVTSFWLGSNLGASGHASCLWTKLETHDAGAVPAFEPEFVLLTDSIGAGAEVGSVRCVVSGSNIYTVAESRTRAGIKALGVSGHKVEDQEAVWDASPHKGQPYVKAVLVQLGVNNLGAGLENDTVIAGRLQGLVDNIKLAGHDVVLCTVTPCKSYLDSINGTAYGYWQDLNTAIMAGLTDVDATCDTVTPLNDGTDNLLNESNVDGVHPAKTNRYRMAQQWRGSFVALGHLP